MSGSGYVRKALLCAGLLAVAALSFAGPTDRFFAETPGVNALDRRAEEFYDASIRGGLYTYAIARGLNAVISLVQDVQITPFVATIPVGQVLDPVNDLIESFSWVVLVSIASLGIQKFFMEIGAWLGIQVLLGISLLVIAASLWLPDRRKGRGLMRAGARLLVLSLLVRFCIPLVVAATGGISDRFLKERNDRATEAIEKTRNEIEFVEQMQDEALQQAAPGAGEEPPEEADLWERVKGILRGSAEPIDLRARFEELRERVSSAIEHLVDLIVVFVLKTLIVPLILLWAVVRLGLRAAGRGVDRVFP